MTADIPIPLICTVIALLACFYAGYTDLTRGVVRNKLTFSLIGIGLILNAIYAVMIGKISFIITCILFTAIIYAMGYAFWRIKAWAGGDAKLFTGLAALLPFYPLQFYPAILSYNLFGVNFPIIAAYGFPFTLVINSLLSVFPFLLIYLLFIVIRNKPELLDELAAPIKEYKKNIVLTLIITSSVTLTLFITLYFNLTSYLGYQLIIVSLILIYLLTLVISKMPNRLKAVIISILIVFGLYNNLNNLILALSSMVVLFIIITLTGILRNLLFSVNKKALQDDYKTEDLKEDMILAHSLYEDENRVYFDDKSLIAKVKESVDSGDPFGFMKPKGKLLIGSMAAGLTNEDIKLLKTLYTEDKIKNEIKIKKGFHFVPSMFMGLVISLFVGDLALIFQKILFAIFT
ncbi:MAG: hypothetical protein HZC47_07610 [Methanobacterium sp.]|uniref:A24 family peptidase C-terminal domain-containing protein n=1 Tax=Methanobacterium sp. TaxID=2164 RepID=UPI003D64ADB9|nr:hypothetical protein [Methanobacterium sp.]